jgi:hypothetical protein
MRPRPISNSILPGRTTLFDPCHSKLSVREQPVEHSIGNSLFVKTQWDEEVGTSYEDRKFMTIMNSEFTKDSKTPKRLLVRFGPDKSTLFKDCSL